MDIDARKRLCLMNELLIAHDTLRLGWGYLQKIDLGNDQYFPVFHFLSTGLERYMKCCCCIIQKAETDKYPNSGELRSYGHNLITIKGKLEDKYKLYVKNDSESTFLESDFALCKVFSMLSDFAKNARYYNLDFVAEQNTCNTSDIISEWQHFELELGNKLKIPLYTEIDPYPKINASIVGSLERFIKDMTDILYQPPIFDVCSTYITCVTLDFRTLTDYGTHNYRQEKSRKFDPDIRFIEFTHEGLTKDNIPYQIVNKAEYAEDEWPFMVDQVTVMNLGQSAYAIGIDGLIYGLNGLALGRHKLPDPLDMDVAKMGRSVAPFMAIAASLTPGKGKDKGNGSIH